MKSMQKNNIPNVAVIGGGAAGLMAAGFAAAEGARVTVFEKNAKCARKVAITGKGRCNLTNNCTTQEFLQNVTKNPRFLYAALSALDPYSTMELFEELGVPLKTERGRRVFPVSDRAFDIVDALLRHAKAATIVNQAVDSLASADGCINGLYTLDGAFHPFDAVILATGGRSYPVTGSTGDGYRMASALGHTVTPLIPSLVPLTSNSKYCRDMQGLSLKNVGMQIRNRVSNKVLFEDFGEMLFTHFGLSGPMILSASAHLTGQDLSALCAVFDLKPALDEKTLDTRLLSDFSKYANRDFINALHDLLPEKMIPVIVDATGIDGRKKVNSITKPERQTLLKTLKNFSIPLLGFRPIEEAIVTSGGISVKEVDPKTMMSKLISNLFFAGEILDVDAYTGGYNLQIAFSTGALAGTYAARTNGGNI